MNTPLLDEITQAALNKVEILVLRGQGNELINECKNVSGTNCGWQAYRMAHVVKDYAEYLQDIKEAANDD